MNKKMFWLVWGIGVVPMLLAFAMYFTGLLVPTERTHAGELLVEQHIDDWHLLGQVGTERRWQLLLTKQSDCDQLCDQWSGLLVNLHIALGKEQPRVSLVLLDQHSTALKPVEYNKLGSGIWIVDPLGNMVLRYRLDDEPSLILKDLRKLLKMSRIG